MSVLATPSRLALGRLRAFAGIPLPAGVAPIILAVAVGVVAGFSAVALQELVEGFDELFFGELAPAITDAAGNWAILLVPVIVVVPVTWAITRWAPETRGHGVPAVMRAVETQGGRVPLRVPVVKGIAPGRRSGSGRRCSAAASSPPTRSTATRSRRSTSRSGTSRARRPVCPSTSCWAGPVRERVVCYPHTQGATKAELIRNCEAAVGEGWKFVRWGQPATGESLEPRPSGELEPRQSVALSIELMTAVREAVGPETEICLDVHTRLGPAQVEELCRGLEPLRPFFIEDPLRSENLNAYRRLRQRVRLPIAAGEQWSSKWEFRQVIEEELIDYARIDIGIAGGLTEALKIAHWAETHYIDIVPHNPLGPVSAAAGVALCMATTNVGVQEMPRRPGSFAQRLFPQQIGWADGYAFCPDVPGLGVEFDLEAAEQAKVDPRSWPPRLRRRDGSFTNW